MFADFLIDSSRFIHVIGLALGVGAGSFADCSLLCKLNQKITVNDMDNLSIIHYIVWVGVAMLWTSGLIILYARTGFSFALFTPKIVIKLVVVTILTANAVMLGIIAMPILKRNIGHTFLSFKLEDKVTLCLLGALSVASWLSGLILGIFSVLRLANYETIMPIVTMLYMTAIFGAILLALLLHILWERKILTKSKAKEMNPESTLNLLIKAPDDIHNNALYISACATKIQSIPVPRQRP